MEGLHKQYREGYKRNPSELEELRRHSPPAAEERRLLFFWRWYVIFRLINCASPSLLQSINRLSERPLIILCQTIILSSLLAPQPIFFDCLSRERNCDYTEAVVKWKSHYVSMPKMPNLTKITCGTFKNLNMFGVFPITDTWGCSKAIATNISAVRASDAAGYVARMYETTKSRQQLMIETGIGLVKKEFNARPEVCQKLNRSSRLPGNVLRHKQSEELAPTVACRYDPK